MQHAVRLTSHPRLEVDEIEQLAAGDGRLLLAQILRADAVGDAGAMRVDQRRLFGDVNRGRDRGDVEDDAHLARARRAHLDELAVRGEPGAGQRQPVDAERQPVEGERAVGGLEHPVGLRRVARQRACGRDREPGRVDHRQADFARGQLRARRRARQEHQRRQRAETWKRADSSRANPGAIVADHGVRPAIAHILPAMIAAHGQTQTASFHRRKIRSLFQGDHAVHRQQRRLRHRRSAIVVIWAVLGPVFGFSDTWQLVINTGTTIVTFLMVFLIQRTAEQGRAGHPPEAERAGGGAAGRQQPPDRRRGAVGRRAASPEAALRRARRAGPARGRTSPNRTRSKRPGSVTRSRADGHGETTEAALVVK